MMIEELQGNFNHRHEDVFGETYQKFQHHALGDTDKITKEINSDRQSVEAQPNYNGLQQSTSATPNTNIESQTQLI
jgi:hypothetical protein